MDLVCRHSDTLVFVEVKTRSSLAFGRPHEAVDSAKERLIIDGALGWLRLLHHPDILIRFDIVEVIIEPGKRPQCTVLENAFTMPNHFVY